MILPGDTGRHLCLREAPQSSSFWGGGQEELPTGSHCDRCLANIPDMLGAQRHVPSFTG